jgi:RimJ/RimL family protein N-acetyltransferase
MRRPEVTLATGRAVLVPFAREDAGELLELFQTPEVRRFLLDDTVVDARWMLAEIAASEALFARTGTGLWSVRLPGEPPIVGFVGFRATRAPQRLQLLYGLSPAHWGRGLANEVAERVCDHAFRHLGVEVVVATTDLPNAASAKVLRRLGMDFIGRTDDGPAGTAEFAVDRATWLAQHDGAD